MEKHCTALKQNVAAERKKFLLGFVYFKARVDLNFDFVLGNDEFCGLRSCDVVLKKFELYVRF